MTERKVIHIVSIFLISCAKVQHFYEIRKFYLPFSRLHVLFIWSFGYLTLRIIGFSVALDIQNAVLEEFIRHS